MGNSHSHGTTSPHRSRSPARKGSRSPAGRGSRSPAGKGSRSPARKGSLPHQPSQRCNFCGDKYILRPPPFQEHGYCDDVCQLNGQPGHARCQSCSKPFKFDTNLLSSPTGFCSQICESNYPERKWLTKDCQVCGLTYSFAYLPDRGVCQLCQLSVVPTAFGLGAETFGPLNIILRATSRHHEIGQRHQNLRVMENLHLNSH